MVAEDRSAFAVGAISSFSHTSTVPGFARLELVENMPSERNEAPAGNGQKSVAAEIASLLEESVPTTEELKRRRAFYRALENLRAGQPRASGPFLSAEEIEREDRAR
jgi:hypothetical protein